MLTLSPGDHIRVWRGAYHHHGFFVDQNAVVHFTDVRNSKAGASVRRCTLTVFESGGAVERVAYRKSVPARQVVRRALSQPAAFALLAGVVVYRLGTKRVPRPALPPPGRL